MRHAPMFLHADLDAFFASVEQRDAPELRGRPVIVGGGVVLAASYEARACGVESGMGGAQARRLCPDAVVVPARFSAYVEASRAVFAIFEQTTPLVEGISIDEAFLDVRGLERISGTAPEIAERLRRTVRAEVGLPITVGVAATKHLSKVASAVAKPDGLLVVEPGTELAFLHPLPVERLWGVGPVTSRRLRAAGIATVGDVAALPEEALCMLLGPAAGRHLHALANNRDPRRVRTGRRRRSIGGQRALGRRPRSFAELDAILTGLVDRIARRLRRAERLCRTVILRLRFGDFSRATRSRTLPEPTAETGIVLATARELLTAARPLIEQRGITLIGLSLSNLEDAGAAQLALQLEPGPGGRAPPAHPPEAVALDAAVDDVRERFGSDAITRAVLLGRDGGIEMPTLPD